VQVYNLNFVDDDETTRHLLVAASTVLDVRPTPLSFAARPATKASIRDAERLVARRRSRENMPPTRRDRSVITQSRENGDRYRQLAQGYNGNLGEHV
jgi:hypothetical protein